MLRLQLAIVAAFLCGSVLASFDGKECLAQRIYKYDVTPEMQCTDPNLCGGKPLILTPYIKEGKTKQAREMSKVAPLAGLTSYSAFFTTNATLKNNMFFWYWPVIGKDPTKVPLLIWLQGGPGASSLFGLFEENGPIKVNQKFQVERRNITWANNYNMLYIDNPVGAGFSFTATGYGYANNSKHDVAENLYSLLQQFYEVFPELLDVDLYITGESYGGHYVPSFAYWVHTHNKIAKEKGPLVKDGYNQAKPIPFKGIAIGDGWIDPITQVTQYPPLFFYFGLADKAEEKIAQDYITSVISLIKAGRYTQAFDIWDEMLNGDIWHYPTFYYNITGSLDYDAYVPTPHSKQYGPWEQYVTLKTVRPMIHVGDAVFNGGRPCELHLLADFMHTLKPELATLMDNYKVMLYNGQVDVIVGAPLTEAMIPTIPWKGMNNWPMVQKKVWYTGKEGRTPAGYVRKLGEFVQVIVRDCGHLVPHGQPARAFDMITRFVEGKKF